MEASIQLTREQCDFFTTRGYLILQNVLTAAETKGLQTRAQEIHDLPRTADVPWMPYEEINASSNRVLCRTENFANYHDGFNKLLPGPKSLHIDSTAYTHIKRVEHLTILMAVDDTNMQNIGLEVVDGSHNTEVPIGDDNCIVPEWVEMQTWTRVELQADQLLVFGSYLAHRSGPNSSSGDRKALYATYNCACEGDLHDPYYADHAKLWPATHMQEEGKDYSQGEMRYGFGGPMLSIGLGKQLRV
ncbi:MAG: hypothetical protein MMC33_006901 [Icmadophila ericetorum]|nr:hypothetical protein [Icmadophila ericetorum]